MKKHKYCCIRFQENVEEEIIIKAEEYDETEWYLKGGHIFIFVLFVAQILKVMAMANMIKNLIF